MYGGHLQQNGWPELNFASYGETITTVHLWSQIVGKIRLKSSPWLNHSWHVTLYVSPQGLTTHSIPYDNGLFELVFDFHQHKLIISTSEGASEKIQLYPRTVASFYSELFGELEAVGIRVKIHGKPNELDTATPFAEDEAYRQYDREQISLYWKALVKIEPVFSRFRARFAGKCSPVHLFWGAFDLAVSRFSGREAPKHPGGAPNIPLEVMQEAYSHEVSSAGFWGGSENFPQAAFYAYCYPTPGTFGQQRVAPEEAYFSQEMGEYFLTYEVVRRSANPGDTLMQFLQSTYLAAAETGHWNRETLEFKDFKREFQVNTPG